MGVTGATMPAASALPSPPTQAETTAATPLAESTAQEAQATAHSEAAARQAPLRTQGAGSKRDGTRSVATPEDFATLLQANTEASAATAPSLNAAATLPEEKTADVATGDTGNLPDQLLAMLDASWMKPSAPPASAVAPTSQATAANSAPVTSTLAAPSLADRNPMPDVAAIATASQAEASASADASIGMDSPFPDALATTATSDANGPIPSFPAVMPTSANTTRTMMAAPVSVPADPQAGFDDGFGARLVWLAEQRLGHAEIRLNPEHLGPIEVRVQMDGTQVNAEFQSAHASVRQAIEASMPRLREMLGQQGLQLGQTDVGQRHAGSGQPAREGTDSNSPTGAPLNAQTPLRSLRSRGLLDEYA